MNTNKLCKVNQNELSGDDLVIRPLKQGKLVVDASQIVDYQAEFNKLNKEKERLANEIARGEKMLSNENFVKKAPQQKIEQEKEKLENYKKQYDIISCQLVEVEKKVK